MRFSLRLTALATVVLVLVVTLPATTPVVCAWPNLDVLDEYPNETGDTCPLSGNANPQTEKGKVNALKNRYTLPTNGFETMLLSQLFALPSGTASTPPTSADPNHNRAVTVVGYVREVKPGGTRGESCNCKATRRDLVDTHIEIVLDPNSHDETGKGMVVVETTERIRRLAHEGLLTSNIGNDWSHQALRDRLLGRWVKLSGWLFYDVSHHKESWRVDPQNRLPNNNWRETGWEIHPVMGIETGVRPPSDAGRGTPPVGDDDDDGNNPNDSRQPIFGNRNSHVYHLPECPGYRAISPRNRVAFRSETAARDAGYRRAGNCP
jgi:hypothetical protein